METSKLDDPMPNSSKNRGVARLLQGKNKGVGKLAFTAKMATKAVNRLLALRKEKGNWRAVETETGINFATANSIANGKRKVTLDIIQKLGNQKPKRYYKNYRLREYYLARWVRKHAKT